MHHEEVCHVCRGEGEGGRGGSVDESKAHDDMHGGGRGGSMDEVAHDTCGGEGGGRRIGMLMDDASTHTSELGKGGRPRRRVEGLVNGVASSDACDGKLRDINFSHEA